MLVARQIDNGWNSNPSRVREGAQLRPREADVLHLSMCLLFGVFFLIILVLVHAILLRKLAR